MWMCKGRSHKCYNKGRECTRPQLVPLAE
ncbi:hypothetical protein GCK32_002518 [Trichostrongylus colubriformis]|uniref:Uncharacterized protein n=1 Tax=Trichostrongylus colubriformis TaxID=6319 RepID=A0AAN8IE90_TRICO